MIERDGPSLPLPAQHVLRQQLVLLLNGIQVLRCQLRRVPRGANHRLHAQLREAQIIGHMEKVLREVRVGVGKGSPHVIIFPATGRHQLLELGYNPVIAAVSRIIHPSPVVDLLPAIQGQHHIAHLPVGKVDHVVVNQHTVRGKSEAEVLPSFFLHASGISHQTLDHVPVHQRLAAKEIHLQVPPAAGVIHEKVQSPPAHLEAHQRPITVILALAGKAVPAVEVAGMGHV